MITNPRLSFYYCIAKGTLILAEFASKEEEGIEALALRCIENIPPHHSMISHTVNKRTYAFIIDGLFSYFAILDESVTKSESLWLFNRLKSAIESLISDGSVTDSSLDNTIQHCLQSKLDPVFAEIFGGGDNYKDLDLELELDVVGSPRSVTREIKNNQRGGGKGGALMPLLGKPLRVLKNKKRLQTEVKSEGNWTEKKMDLGGGKGVRNGLIHDHHHHHHHRHKAKQIWRKHVWVVLIFDLCICVLLFGIWLWVCKGFQCIQG